MPGLVTVTSASVPLVTTADADTFLRIDTSDDDTLVASLVAAATQYAEDFTGRALMTQTLKYTLDSFPRNDEPLDLPRPPLQSVSAVTYYSTAGVLTTFSSASYHVDTTSEPGRIALVDGSAWPSVQDNRPGAVQVQFVAGYGSVSSLVPAGITAAVRLLVGNWYENREATVSGGINTKLDLATESLLYMNLAAAPFVPRLETDED